MGNPDADDFLTCVMGRSNDDTIIRVGSVLLLMVGIPAIMMVFIAALGTEDTDSIAFQLLTALENHLTSITLFYSIFNSFIVYMIIQAYYKHHLRDMVWMSSLRGYASSGGKDVSELKKITGPFASNRAHIIVKVAFWYFAFVLISHTVMAIMLSTKTIDDYLATDITQIISAFLVFELALASCYVFVSVRKDDRIQCDFTSEWARLMKDEIPDAEPMATRIKMRRIWPHILIIIVTLGLYSFVFALWAVHTMNLHISRQNTYEESVLKWIMDREGAKGIEGIEEELQPGLVNLGLRMFT